MRYCNRSVDVKRAGRRGLSAGRCLITIFLVLFEAGEMSGQQPQKGVQPIVSMRDVPKIAAKAHKKSYNLRIVTTEWMDSGIDVNAGEVLQVSATGSFTLGDGRVVGPEGLTRGWKDTLRQFPLNGAPAGALIGRVSELEASVPFPVGAEGRVTMPTSGRLYLRVNANGDLAGTGSYDVKIRFEAETTHTEATEEADPKRALGLSGIVGPSLFEDIPRRVADRAGHAGDMVNFALVGTEAQVNAAFKAAGWVAVDHSVQDAVLHGILATLGHEAYTAMPMSTLYLFGRAQDLSFARGDPLKVAAERHHLRVWKTTEKVDQAPLWVGSATHDIGFETDQRNGDVTHKIDPKVDDERDFLLKSFDAAGVFSSAAYVAPTDALRKAQTATGGEFFSDGRVVVMALK